MGISRRGDSGRWKAEVYHEGIKVCSKTFASRELAKAWHDLRHAEILKGQIGIKSRKASPTLRELATRYLKAIQPQTRKDTFRYYRSRLSRHIVPALGDKRIADLGRLAITNYLTGRLQAGMSPASYGKELQILKRLFNWAVEQDILEANPLGRMKRIKAPKTTEPRFYTPDEVQAILGPLQANALGLMLAAFRTGMRYRELVAFRHEWCDMRRDVIRIPNTIEFSPKGHKSRTIPLATDLKAWLLTRTPTAGRVFVSEREPHAPLRGFRRLLQRIEKQTGHFLKLHDCRHTYASFLIAEGVPLTEVQAALGHATITTTMIYAHLSPDYLANVRTALSRAAGTPGLRVVRQA